MCGIVGIHGSPDAAGLACTGLFALQHRGQEAAGIAAADGDRVQVRAGLGLVSEVFTGAALRSLAGFAAVGHARYSTAGASHVRNAQPLLFNCVHGPLAIAHNGTLTNALALRRSLEAGGAIFQSSTDSEVVVHLVARRRGPVLKAIVSALREVEGAYSLLFLAPDSLVAVRDPLGFRPLVLGRLGEAWVFASETTALDLMGAELVREVEPGEVLSAGPGGIRSLKPFPAAAAPARCVFEHVYFARPDSVVFGRGVQGARTEAGRALARELAPFLARARPDAVVPVPDSGIPAALGFSREAGIPMELGIVRSHYVGRSFIQPGQGLREGAVALKLSPVREALAGRSIVLVDDSVVRGTTSRKICRMLRRQGVRAIHMAVASPPIRFPCRYGIDTPDRNELLASARSPHAIRRFLGVDSIHYLGLDGLLGGRPGYCDACFTGRYPTRLTDAGQPDEPSARAAAAPAAAAIHAESPPASPGAC